MLFSTVDRVVRSVETVYASSDSNQTNFILGGLIIPPSSPSLLGCGLGADDFIQHVPSELYRKLLLNRVQILHPSTK